jgi:phosphoglycolate phosphatase
MKATPANSSNALLMFDFDGVIADSLDHQCRAYIETLRARGYDELATAEQFLTFTEDNWSAALDRVGLSARVVGDLEDAFAALPCPELFPGMAAVLERLATTHPVVVITSGRTDTVERILDEHGVRGVSEVIGGDQEPSKMLKIDAVRHRLGCALPGWYVGDTVGDIVEARAAGAGTVAVDWGWHSPERLRCAAPDHVAHTPADLLELFHCEAVLDCTR